MANNTLNSAMSKCRYEGWVTEQQYEDYKKLRIKAEKFDKIYELSERCDISMSEFWKAFNEVVDE